MSEVIVLSIDGSIRRALGLIVDVLLLLERVVLRTLTFRIDMSRLVTELDRAIVGAAPLILLAGLGTGAVMIWQTDEGLARFGASAYSARIVALSLVRELSPVLVGLLMAGRAGSAMAAELGTMATSDQLLAMRALALDWTRHLVAPRVLALSLGVPCLVLLFDAAGLAGGFLVGVMERGIPSGAYIDATLQALQKGDLECGLVKGLLFGLLISLIGCRQGLTTDRDRGAAAVGAATTRAVVAASIAVLLADAAVTRLYLGLFR